MTIAATGLRGEAIQKLEALVSKSATAQTRAGLTEAQMPSRIFWPDLENPFSVEFPYFVITHRQTRSTRDSSSSFDRSGMLALKIVDVAQHDVVTPGGRKDALTAFLNFVDGVSADMEAASILNDNLTVQEWRDSIPPSMSDPRKESDKQTNRPYFFLEIEVAWGPGGGGQ